MTWRGIGVYRKLADSNDNRVADRVFDRYARVETIKLRAARDKYEAAYLHLTEPLVSIIIPTYNRGQLLVERTLPSVYAQTYQNFEVVIVGDHCTEETERILSSIKHPKIQFYNLPQRAKYPTQPEAFRKVAGIAALNRAHELTRGQWLAHLDDDDVYLPEHLEKLLHLAQVTGSEFVFGRSRVEVEPGIWEQRGAGTALPNGHPPYRTPSGTYISHSAILYQSYLKLFEYDIDAWKIGFGGDAHRWQRMGRAGVCSKALDEIVVLLPLLPDEKERRLRLTQVEG